MTWPVNPDDPIRVAVSDHMSVDGVAIRIALRLDYEHIRVMNINEEGYTTWTDVDQMADNYSPTLRLSHGFARALLDALLRYYQGASDMQTTRSDLLHERGRVDRLVEVISGIATSASHSRERLFHAQAQSR
jgi:hypothetical protein